MRRPRTACRPKSNIIKPGVRVGTAFSLILTTLRGIPNFFETAENVGAHPCAKPMVDMEGCLDLI
jgi:hypothetical protein